MARETVLSFSDKDMFVIRYELSPIKIMPESILGSITPGLPIPQAPAFHTTVGNTTYSAVEMFTHLGSGLLVVPLVGIISNVAIAKAFCKFLFWYFSSKLLNVFIVLLMQQIYHCFTRIL